MKPAALAIAVVALSCMLAAHAAPDDGDDATGAFFKAFHAQQDAFAEYRYLTSAEVQGNPLLRDMAAQLLATELSFLGRPQEALRAFPYRGASHPDQSLPTTAGFDSRPAVDWVAAQAGDYRVVMVNEAHHVPQTRVLTFLLLRALRDKGYTHLAVETLANDGSDPMPKGYPVRMTGIYTRDPLFAELLREARRLGYVLVPYEPNDEGDGEQTQQQRETGQARAIADLLAKQPGAKVLVHAGYAHINEAQEGMPDDARPMAMELARISGLPLLTIDQAKTRSWEADDIDTAGRRLSRDFAVKAPSVLVGRDDGKVWSHAPGSNDATVLMPAAPVSALRPDWLALAGRRPAIAIDLSPCLGHLPCLAEARHAGEGDDAIPADQFVMLAAGEAATPLYLAPGKYRLRLLGNDGAPLVQRELEVPALPIASMESE